MGAVLVSFCKSKSEPMSGREVGNLERNFSPGTDPAFASHVCQSRSSERG